MREEGGGSSRQRTIDTTDWTMLRDTFMAISLHVGNIMIFRQLTKPLPKNRCSSGIGKEGALGMQKTEQLFQWYGEGGSSRHAED